MSLFDEKYLGDGTTLVRVRTDKLAPNIQTGDTVVVREATTADPGDLIIAVNDRKALREVLCEIIKVDPIDAALDPQRPLRIAKAWLRENGHRCGPSDETDQRIDSQTPEEGR